MIIVLWLLIIVWRIRVEERALLAARRTDTAPMPVTASPSFRSSGDVHLFPSWSVPVFFADAHPLGVVPGQWAG